MRSSIWRFVSSGLESEHALIFLNLKQLFLYRLVGPGWNHGTTVRLSIATDDHNLLFSGNSVRTCLSF